MDDIRIAKRYIRTSKGADDRGILFDLPFTSYKNIMRAKKCTITGKVVTSDLQFRDTPRYLTVDRSDNTHGYIKGNVIACCHAANQYKSILESDAEGLTEQDKIKVLEYYLEVLKKRPENNK